MDQGALQERIETLVRDRVDPRSPQAGAIDDVIAALDAGTLRVCEPIDGKWVTHGWIKEAILLYFARRETSVIEAGPALQFFDKLPLKSDYASTGVRCVPPGVARYGSFLGRGTILMPGYVNIGAYIGENSMIDTWATVGSCAQIGNNVHLSGGVGIGGVLEPPQAQPVIIEDGAFIGSRCIVVEGVHVQADAVLGAGVVLTASTPIVDVRGAQATTTRGRVSARSVVIPGMLPKKFAAGQFSTPCALVIGTRDAATDQKTSLNAALRDYEVAV
ncbi:MAG: 2,3,4,5-tetrahydropyridine-2,6-dicarboxylate N-succinyltransferase [Candidatus Eremiobacteraeota bacterium]|nr:2,3,4,5-tetrahydropyridine-2,6-dicarboxylate N-succinyltransferase [Candidatus Eremiobacteraeota bacterium]